jgi:hypothetical protein
MGALVLDVGAWYHSYRSAQATADAAALAGAQALPDTAAATALARDYADRNGGMGPGTISFSSQITPNDTITVTAERDVPGFLARVFGIFSVDVGAKAAARSEVIKEAKYVAPITVHYKHPLLNCKGGANATCNPTFGQSTTLDLEDLHQKGGGDGAGAFGLIDLSSNSDGGTGNVGAGTLAGWLVNGYGDYLPLGTYDSAPSANFNNSQFIDAMNSVLGKEVLFPVYRVLRGPGANAKYEIVGWVGFVITSFDPSGSSGTITGYFVRYIADGVQADSGGGPDFGAHKILLIS